LADADVRVICGPTAAGKSAVALWLAERHQVTIVSADSRQIYRGFDIGTAKPSAAERARVPHCGIDVVDPTERFSAAAWADAAEGWITDAERSGRAPLVVGGTGFYLRAFFEGLFDEPVLDPDRRSALQAVLGELSTQQLARWVGVLDPDRATFGRKQLLRALEVALLTGERVSVLHRARARPAPRRARYLLVDPPAGPGLASRIAARIDQMLDAGWLEEARRLAAVVPESAPAWQSSGYRVMRALAAGTIGREEAVQRAVVETRQYAKRQRTWFRHQLPLERVTRLDPTASDWRERVERWFTEVEGSGGES
jgi:tRNA dimethylallyltransferase